MLKFIKSNWILILILLLGIFFRFWHIKTFPNGLFPDEAANGLDINSIFHGHLQPFYERGNGREALFFYMLAASVAVFGRGPWQHHIVTATVGIIEIIVTYLLVKRMFGKSVALLTSFFMACSSYMVMLNHNGFRANTIPLFTSLTFLFVVKFFQTSESDKKSRLKTAFWAGISFGLGFYTYISYRMMIPIVVAFAFLAAVAYRDKLMVLARKFWPYKKAFLVGFVIAFAWLGIYFIQHPQSFVGRAGQVSIFNKDLNQGNVAGTFITVVKKTLLGFFTQGDNNWRQNVAGAPFLSPFISPFFLIIAIWFTFESFKFIYNAWYKKMDQPTFHKSLLAIWFWLMIVPEITTAEGIPHGLRIIGVIPPIFIMSAYGVHAFWTWLSKIFPSSQSLVVFTGVFCALIFSYNYYLVFQVAAKSPDMYYAYRSDLTDVSNYLNQRNNKYQTYLSLDDFSVQTVEYLTTPTNNPYQLVDPAHTYLVNLKSDDQVVFTQSTIYDTKKFIEAHPEAILNRVDKSPFGDIIMMVYQEP